MRSIQNGGFACAPFHRECDFTVPVADHPVGVLGEETGTLLHQKRSKPDAGFESGLFDFSSQSFESVREFPVADEPVPQRRLISVVQLEVFQRIFLPVGVQIAAFSRMSFSRDVAEVVIPAAPAVRKMIPGAGVHFPAPDIGKMFQKRVRVRSGKNQELLGADGFAGIDGDSVRIGVNGVFPDSLLPKLNDDARHLIRRCDKTGQNGESAFPVVQKSDSSPEKRFGVSLVYSDGIETANGL